ncbi:MAG: glycosyltransferase [bacterium]
MKLSAVIITHNEERNIGRCLESLKGVADEIIVVDSGSTDRTPQICAEAEVTFVSHPWEGYSEQKNYANSLATGDWILSIDADEIFSPQLLKSMLKFKQSQPNPNVVYRFKRLTNYCGQWIHHCGWYPDRCARLWARGIAHWEGMIHEELRYDTHVKLVTLKGDLLHYSYYSVEEHKQRMAIYAPLSAEQNFARGKRCGIASIFLRPTWTFFRAYLFKGGFLEGRAGLTISRILYTYTRDKYTTLYKLCHDTSSKRILTDLSMLRHPYCGLGMISMNYGRWIGAHNGAGFDITLLVPRKYIGKFGYGVKYLESKNIYRILPWLMPHFDVWHSVYQLSPFRPASSRTRRILTIHDFNLLHYKSPAKSRRYRRRLQRECNKSSHICFISNFVANDAPNFLDLSNKPINVIHNAVENITQGPQEPPTGIDNHRPFLLFIGVVARKKNIHSLPPMMRLLEDYDLVVAGNTDSDYARQLKESCDQQRGIHFLGPVNDNERRWLYAHCSALIFPSLFEGFGLPVIEAMQWGKPVFCSTATSLPEVGGKHAFYFDSFEPEAMARKVAEGLRCFTPQQAEEEKAYAATFGYDRYMSQYLKLYSDNA